ncbi:hypothetical protein [Glaciihabitans sp. UYNi722]|uniref:hypothetical protein n=1 Tax=Glaciihabitans sp. UYNi722 TaxID=3156344 RepID=UPI00339213EE
MLAASRRRIAQAGYDTLRLLEADAALLPRDRIEQILTADGRESQLDALFASYALSVFPEWHPAWNDGIALVRPGGRAGIVDMRPPTGKASVLRPLAALGGSDIHARPWRVFEADLSNVELTTSAAATSLRQQASCDFPPASANGLFAMRSVALG